MSRLQKYQVADNITSVEGFFKTDSKRVLAQLAKDPTVSIERLRLMAMSVGATLDCFFVMKKKKGNPNDPSTPHGKAQVFKSKDDIIGQIFVRNQNVRIQVAHQKYDANKHTKTNKHTNTNDNTKRKNTKRKRSSGGSSTAVAVATATPSNSDFMGQIIKSLITTVPPLLTTMGVPHAETIGTAIGTLAPVSNALSGMYAARQTPGRRLVAAKKTYNRLSEELGRNDGNNDTNKNTYVRKAYDEAKAAFDEVQKDERARVTGIEGLVDTHIDDFCDKVTTLESSVNKYNLAFQRSGQNIVTTVATLPLSLAVSAVTHLGMCNYMSLAVATVTAVAGFYYYSEHVEDTEERARLESYNAYIVEQQRQNDAYEQKIAADKEVERLRLEAEEHATMSYKIKNRIDMFKTYLRENTATALCTLPIMLGGLYASYRYSALNQFSASIYSDPTHKVDAIQVKMNPELKTYADTKFCLKGIDRELHNMFKRHPTVERVYYDVIFYQHQRQHKYVTRAILNSHLIRSDGSVRDSVAEIALAIRAHWKMSGLVGVAATRIANLFTMRRRSTPHREAISESDDSSVSEEETAEQDEAPTSSSSSSLKRSSSKHKTKRRTKHKTKRRSKHKTKHNASSNSTSNPIVESQEPADDAPQ
jgi:hypothetical protein